MRDEASSYEPTDEWLERINHEFIRNDVPHKQQFITAVRKGLDELDRGESIPLENAERELPSWTK